MSMQLVSEKLLKREIKRLEDSGATEEKGLLYHLCKKELAVIEKLKINKIDMRGEIEETVERIESQAIYFMNPQEFDEMEEKARRYDEICELTNLDMRVREIF